MRITVCVCVCVCVCVRATCLHASFQASASNRLRVCPKLRMQTKETARACGEIQIIIVILVSMIVILTMIVILV